MSEFDQKPCIELDTRNLGSTVLEINCTAKPSMPNTKLKPLPSIEAGARRLARECLPQNREWCLRLALAVLRTFSPNYVLSIANEARPSIEVGVMELVLAYLAHSLGYVGVREPTGAISLRRVNEPSGVGIKNGEFTIDITPLINGEYKHEQAGTEFGPFTIEQAGEGGLARVFGRLLRWH
jgi:hypothetical protein